MADNATFLKTNSKLINYMAYPKFLNELPINNTAKHIYVLLLNRARLSMQQGWADENGNVYILYSVKNLSIDSGRCDRAVRYALNSLEKNHLILRGEQIAGRGRQIFVKTGESFCSPGVQKTAVQGCKELHPNKIDKYKIIDSKYICGEDESL